MDPTAERVARNEAAFRSANERIEEAAEGLQQAPFLCECADPACTLTVWLSFDEYEAVRAAPNRFFMIPGHERHAGQWSRVVDRTKSYVVTEKLGDAGVVAAEESERVEQTDG
jgi:hypothetical protein